MSDKCQWKGDEDNWSSILYETSCGVGIPFRAFEECSLEESICKFCPNCGKDIEEVKNGG